jgi:hypothetical protein
MQVNGTGWPRGLAAQPGPLSPLPTSIRELLGASGIGRARHQIVEQVKRRRVRRRHELGRRHRRAVPALGRLARRLEAADASPLRLDRLDLRCDLERGDRGVQRPRRRPQHEEAVGPVHVQAQGLQAGQHRAHRGWQPVACTSHVYQVFETWRVHLISVPTFT